MANKKITINGNGNANNLMKTLVRNDILNNKRRSPDWRLNYLTTKSKLSNK